MSRQLSVRLLAAFLALALGARARADTDRWFRVLLGGSPSGWMHSSETRSGDTITSAGEMSIKVRRGQISIEISMKSEFVETEGGAPVSMKLRQTLGSTPVDSVFTFGPGGIETSTTQDGQTTVATRPLPAGAWLCPAAADRALREAMARGEKEIVLHTIDPMSGMQVLTNTHRVLGEETIQVNGAPVKVTRLSVETSAMPGVQSTEYVDASGETVRTDTVLGGIAMSLVRAGPEVAADKVGALPELMISTFVKPDRPIDHPRATRSAAYVLTVPEGKLAELPQTGAQRVEAHGESGARVEVNADAPGAAPADDAQNAAYLASTAAANIQDPRVKALAERALRGAHEGKAERAEALRRFVYKYISKKSLDVGFATASEVCRTRTGDCSEHGVLLAALLRADGIPSRVVAGVIYADQFAGEQGIFGYHMWAQALLEKGGQKRWVDLDATLPDSTPFDATHIALGLSDLSDEGGMRSMAAFVSVLGRLRIEVETAR